MSRVGFRRRRPLVLHLYEESLLGDVAVPPVISVVFLQLAPNPGNLYAMEWTGVATKILGRAGLFQQSYVLMMKSYFRLPLVQNTVLFEYVVRDSLLKTYEVRG